MKIASRYTSTIDHTERNSAVRQVVKAGMLDVGSMNIVTRIMGIVLTVIAFQMLAAGLNTLLPGLA
jgi:small neutral amino acid transporter SnatA (MarC family)